MPTWKIINDEGDYEDICTENVGEYVIIEMLHTQIEQYIAK